MWETINKPLSRSDKEEVSFKWHQPLKTSSYRHAACFVELGASKSSRIYHVCIGALWGAQKQLTFKASNDVDFTDVEFGDGDQPHPDGGVVPAIEAIE